LEYLHTRPLTASGLRDILERVSEVDGLFATKEALGDVLCRGSLRYRNYAEEGIQNIYNGWAKSTQRMYCYGWGHFAEFLLVVDEVYLLYGQYLYWLSDEIKEHSDETKVRIKVLSLDNIKSAVNMYCRLMFNVNALDCQANKLLSRGLTRKNPKLPKYKFVWDITAALFSPTYCSLSFFFDVTTTF
jgi:hypothetical protein